MIHRIKSNIAIFIDFVIKSNHIIYRNKDRYIIAYHRVISEEQARKEGVHPSMWISPEALELQIRWMLQVGDIVSYSRILNSNEENDRPWFALTFDDGWMDNFKNFFPITKRYFIPSHIFLATKAIDSGLLLWTEDISIKSKKLLNEGREVQVRNNIMMSWPIGICKPNRLYLNIMELVWLWIEALKLIPSKVRDNLIKQYYSRLGISESPLDGYMLTWREVKVMHQSNVSFGSHTHSHAILKNISLQKIKYELIRSKNIIEKNINSVVDSFCYPNGRYNGREGAILLDCGYKYGFCINNVSLKSKYNDYYIPRFLMSDRSCSIPSYYKLRLLNIPLYRSKPHNPDSEKG